MLLVHVVWNADPHLGARSLAVLSEKSVKGCTQLAAKLGLRVDRREPLLKLRFGPTSVPILRGVDISLGGHSVIADKFRRSEPPVSFVILISIPGSRIGQSLLQGAAPFHLTAEAGDVG